GNILRDPWEEIWQGALFRSFRDRVEDPRWAGLPEKCWECPDLPLCGGGCRIEREARDGNRIADSGHGGGCAGCSGSCGTGKSAAPDLPFTADIALTLLPTGFVPPSGQIDSPRRGSGVMVIGDH
ncbi:MAG: SPASM domain-containing protein, partial [Anaerolineae bacterium]|nr:SPASM domain-containing protein [Anaerolineae bacterium]